MISWDVWLLRENGNRYVASSLYLFELMISCVSCSTLSHCGVPVYTPALRFTRERIAFAAYWFIRPYTGVPVCVES
jgi:hypothetical protein